MNNKFFNYLSNQQDSNVNDLRGKVINAPSFAYYTVYGKYPTPLIRGHEASHETKDINGVAIDKHIPDKAMKELMNIKGIESRASCEGDSPRHITFFIFRPLDQRLEYVRELCINLRKQRLKCQYDIGWQNMYRVCVAEKLWYSEENKKKFEQWWNELPKKIRKAVEETNETYKGD